MEERNRTITLLVLIAMGELWLASDSFGYDLRWLAALFAVGAMAGLTVALILLIQKGGERKPCRPMPARYAEKRRWKSMSNGSTR